jgi:uracil-DNA glycosylase
MLPPVPGSWKTQLSSEIKAPYYAKLRNFVAKEQSQHDIFPRNQDIYQALEFTAPGEVKVLLLGQDPYPGKGQAHGLSFSVRAEVPLPGSLQNIFQELGSDCGCTKPNNGYLAPWAQQGILMLNAVLTVRAGKPNSHAGRGWEKFTDRIIDVVNGLPHPVVFLLWGAYAQKKAVRVDSDRHVIIKAAHPSPQSANHGFFGSHCFSKVNAALKQAGQKEIDWQIPNV